MHIGAIQYGMGVPHQSYGVPMMGYMNQMIPSRPPVMQAPNPEALMIIQMFQSSSDCKYFEVNEK